MCICLFLAQFKLFLIAQIIHRRMIEQIINNTLQKTEESGSGVI
jgi:hypothetical protein